MPHRHIRRRANRWRSSKRTYGWAIALLVFSELLAGCGSSGRIYHPPISSSLTPVPSTISSTDSSAPDPDSQEGQESTEASNNPNDSSGGLTPIGTITQNWTGVTATTSYSIGTPTFGDSSPLPTDVLTACQLTDPAVLESAAYFPISMSISFTSQIATDVLIQPDGVLKKGTAPLSIAGAYIAYLDNTSGSHWSCDDSTQTYTLGPNSQLTLTIWVTVPGLITNQSPHPSIASFTDWSLGAPATILMAGDPIVQASGPHAAACNDDDPPRLIISLFNSPPFSYAGQDSLGPTGTPSAAARPEN